VQRCGTECEKQLEEIQKAFETPKRMELGVCLPRATRLGPTRLGPVWQGPRWIQERTSYRISNWLISQEALSLRPPHSFTPTLPPLPTNPNAPPSMARPSWLGYFSPFGSSRYLWRRKNKNDSSPEMTLFLFAKNFLFLVFL